MNTLDPSRRTLAAGLAALAGYVDAIGFLSADRYFVSFMSGNTTRLATELATQPASALIPALLIGGFILGVSAGGVTGHRAGRWRKPAVLALVTLFLCIACAFRLAGNIAGMMAGLVMAMGALNTALHNGETPVALTYLTGTVVRIGRWLAERINGTPGDAIGPYLTLWCSLATGAIVGAIIYTRIGPVSLLIACLASAALTFAGAQITRRRLRP